MSEKKTVRVDFSKITQKNQSILEFTPEKAQKYFLKPESYCNFNLPIYFDFEPLLLNVHEELNGKALCIFKQGNPSHYDDVNYKILDNKDGRYAWRPRQLIHPVLYVSLVHQITAKENWETICKRFEFFAQNTEIECVSIPSESLTEESNKAEQISNWVQQIEQRSLELALDYKYLTQTDITDCYGAIYTHSVAWALHGKGDMKKKTIKERKVFIGDIIDEHLRSMSYGQTNGIPQDSALMDLIAEMVLGYADSLLLDKIFEESKEESKIKDYKILRYRDDYRIFTNNPRDGEQILKYLTEVMIGLGLKLSTGKTKSSSDVITSSIKDDKLYWMGQKQFQFNLQKRLLIIHGLAKKYPNSGSLIAAMDKFHLSLFCLKDCDKDCNRSCLKNFKDSVIPLISIVVDIAYNNPRTYPYAAAILSFLLDQLSGKKQKKQILKKIIDKLDDIPNTTHLMIWLQRIALGIKVEMDFDEELVQIVLNKNKTLWNSLWLKESMKNHVKSDSIVDQKIITNLPAVISREEIALFKDKYHGSY